MASSNSAPTERAWIKTCLDLGFQPRDVKALRQIYRKHYPQFATNLGAGPPYAIRYDNWLLKREFETAEDATDWAIENYKGSFERWEVVSLATSTPPVCRGDRHG